MGSCEISRSGHVRRSKRLITYETKHRKSQRSARRLVRLLGVRNEEDAVNNREEFLWHLFSSFFFVFHKYKISCSIVFCVFVIIYLSANIYNPFCF